MHRHCHVFFQQCFSASQSPAGTDTWELFLWGVGLCTSGLTSRGFCWPHLRVCWVPCGSKNSCFDVLCMSGTSSHTYRVVHTFGVWKLRRCSACFQPSHQSFAWMKQKSFYWRDWTSLTSKQTVYIMIINALSWEESNQGHTSGKGRNCSACGIVLFSNLTVSCRKEWQDQLFSLWKVCVCI